MNTTQECQAQAIWMLVGTSVYTLPKFVYQIPCTPTTKIIENLGVIKKRSDDRWDWWRFESEWHQTWSGGYQGVATSQEAAEMRVLEGWKVENELQYKPPMFIILVIYRKGIITTILWNEYTETSRYSACRFAQKFGWTVHYITATTSEEAIKMSVEKTMRELNQRGHYG